MEMTKHENVLDKSVVFYRDFWVLKHLNQGLNGFRGGQWAGPPMDTRNQSCPNKLRPV